MATCMSDLIQAALSETKPVIQGPRLEGLTLMDLIIRCKAEIRLTPADTDEWSELDYLF